MAFKINDMIKCRLNLLLGVTDRINQVISEMFFVVNLLVGHTTKHMKHGRSCDTEI